jgi:RNA polymerase sigma-70 factor (sigma-E family)
MRATVAAEHDQGWEQEGASLRALYRDERTSLLHLASLLLRDTGEAEEVVQDAFVRAYLAWNRLRDPDKAAAFLRSAVLNAARSRLRHQRIVARFRPGRSAAAAPAEFIALERLERVRLVEILQTLPVRQRECLALRYLLELSEEETAAALGISRGSVKTHVHRGIASLAGQKEAVA